MNMPHPPEGTGDITGKITTSPGTRTGATPADGRPRLRFTPWASDTQLPLPVVRDGMPDVEVERPVPVPTAAREREREQERTVRRGEITPELNIRRHLLRATLRIGVLGAADLAALGFVLAFLHVADLDWLAATETSGVGFLLAPSGVRSFVPALAVGLAATGNYGSGDRRRDGGRLLLGCVLAACIFAWRQLWANPLVAGAELALLVVTLGMAIVVTRYVLDRAVRRHRARTRIAARTVLVGTATGCTRVFMQRVVSSENGFHVLGYVESGPGRPGPDALGGMADLERVLQEQDADTVIVCGDLAPESVNRVVRSATVNECDLLAVTPAFETAGVHPTIVWRRGRPLIALRAEAARGRGLLLKRGFDVAASAIALVVLSPLLAVVALVVRLESPGPAVFGHLRAGRHGRFFRCLKFRSMYQDAEQRLHGDPVLLRKYIENDFKLPPGEDPRITRVGRFLRRTSLDELPQLVNVLRGDMSLVGPRPIIRAELDQYADDEPLLLSLRPGVTGLWQVNGRSSVAYPARKYMELEYVQTWSLMRDIEILVRTIPAVLRQRGAC